MGAPEKEAKEEEKPQEKEKEKVEEVGGRSEWRFEGIQEGRHSHQWGGVEGKEEEQETKEKGSVAGRERAVTNGLDVSPVDEKKGA